MSESSSDSGPDDKQPVSKKAKSDVSTSEGSKKKTKKEKPETNGSWEIGNKRFLTVRDFKGKLLIDLREYYQDDAGEMKPGRKGISLSRDQWKKMQSIMSDVNEYIEENH